VFQRAIAIARSDAGWLRDALLANAPAAEALEIASDRFGLRLQADVPVARQDRHAVVRTLWISEKGVAGARLVTCWVL